MGYCTYICSSVLAIEQDLRHFYYAKIYTGNIANIRMFPRHNYHSRIKRKPTCVKFCISRKDHWGLVADVSNFPFTTMLESPTSQQLKCSYRLVMKNWFNVLFCKMCVIVLFETQNECKCLNATYLQLW